MKKEDKKLFAVGGFAALIASLCCLGPAIIVLLGLGSVSAGLSIGRFSLLFNLLAVLFFGVAAVLYLNKKNCCSVDGVKSNWKPLLIAFIVMVIFLVLLKYVIAGALWNLLI